MRCRRRGAGTRPLLRVVSTRVSCAGDASMGAFVAAGLFAGHAGCRLNGLYFRLRPITVSQDLSRQQSLKLISFSKSLFIVCLRGAFMGLGLKRDSRELFLRPDGRLMLPAACKNSSQCLLREATIRMCSTSRVVIGVNGLSRIVIIPTGGTSTLTLMSNGCTSPSLWKYLATELAINAAAFCCRIKVICPRSEAVSITSFGG